MCIVYRGGFLRLRNTINVPWISDSKFMEKMDKSVVTSYNNLALVYSDVGDYEQALQQHEKALEIALEGLSSPAFRYWKHL